MRMPRVKGLIRRRLLINYRVDPSVVQRQLPERFRPKLQNGCAVAGVCLIRLERIRPDLVPGPFGVSSENAAHRIAVTWEDGGEVREGVYIPRRDTSSWINRFAGGRLFPGEHRPARFQVEERSGHIQLRMQSLDELVKVTVSGRVSADFPRDSCFRSTDDASRFFEAGSLGYSATSESGKLDGIELRTTEWKVEPLQVDEVYSSYFADKSIFPEGSCSFDCALIMRNIRHEWRAANDLYTERAG
ncbi:MAG TPA: DUF2071 domain-containing protein [Terriglobia bacterium]|nr:DUF2071 domain-containing protein [Terriglobia bacterium]